ncbi:hypothetical protein XENTR_v10017344 [Xenopus tropicalis]|uniref:Lymphocyte antigen 6E-like n=1 Tax=Xenopus tropicalis TaxID=8364 RepID=A0A8J1JR48_XENTR|nr:lymphocyte antigen 6E-like [Xenopus tropicalis]KAE8599826.1 hypothetical protein XENTR_v10017344 [Xenopus tropicalis]
MAALCVSLLLAALCIGTAVPLQCYTCVGSATNANCKIPIICSSIHKYCMTVVGSASGATAVSKSCMPSCTPGIYKILPGSPLRFPAAEPTCATVPLG